MHTHTNTHTETHRRRAEENGGGDGGKDEKRKRRGECWAPGVSAAARVLPAPRNELQLSVYFISGFSSSHRAWLEEATWECEEFVGYESLAKTAEMRRGQRRG